MKIRLGNGEVITVPKGMSEEAFLDLYDSDPDNIATNIASWKPPRRKVRLDSGDVVEVPANVDLSDFVRELDANGSPASDSAVENFAAGVGRGMTNISRNINALAGGDYTPATGEYDDTKVKAELEEHSRLDDALMDTTAGWLGNMGGEIALTALPMARAEAGAAAANANLQGPGLARAAGRTATRPMVAASGVGAGTGALVEGPGARSEGAIGGALGGALGKAVEGAVGRFSRGLMETNPSAQRYAIEHPDEAPLPMLARLPEAGQDGDWAATVWRDFVSAIPGGKRLQKELNVAQLRANDRLLREAAPPGYTGELSADPEKLRNSLLSLDQAYEKAFKEFEGFKLDPKGNPDIPTWTFLEENGLLRDMLEPVAEDGLVDTKTIMNARTHLLQKAEGMTGPNANYVHTLIEKLDDEWLDHIGKVGDEDAVEAFTNLRDKYANYKVAFSVAGRSNPDEFRSSGLGKASRREVTPRRAASGRGPMQYEAEQVESVLGDPMQDPGLWRTVAAGSFMKGIAPRGETPVGSFIGTVGTVLGIGLVGGSRVVERAAMGDMAAQRMLRGLAEKHPEVAEGMRQMFRAGMVSAANQEN